MLTAELLADPEFKRLLAQMRPHSLYLSGEDNLRVTTFNAAAGVTLAIRTRFMRWDGTIVSGDDRHVPNTNRTTNSTIVLTPEGWLLGLEVFATGGTPRAGQCFVVVDVVRGTDATALSLQNLLQGYATDTSRLAWPGMLNRLSPEGPGVIRAIAGTDPAANVEIVETVPVNARWRLIAVTFNLVCDANVANRDVELIFDDGATIYAVAPVGTNQTAGQTRTYSFYQDAARNVVATQTVLTAPLPPIVMMGGHRFSTSATNRQVGDNYSAPGYLVEEWIED